MAQTKDDLPKYRELMYPVLKATDALGGSGNKKEILDRVIDDLDVPEELLAIVYGGDGEERQRNKSIFFDRLEWALSYCKLTGVLDSPGRALYALSGEGRDVLNLDEEEARTVLREKNSETRKSRASRKGKAAEPGDDDGSTLGEEDTTWKTELLDRLHQLSPEAFEEFTLLLLRAYGMSLERVGGSGDEGIDGIGTAPSGDVLSSTVAVQCKRYDPATAISREKVALFQRDASAKGAERAVFVTLGRFSKPARDAARAATPTVDLIDGDRLCELALEKEIGVRSVPQVEEGWFERFTA